MEYEVRTVIKEENVDSVIDALDALSSIKAIEKQVIYNYHTGGDLRLIRSKEYAKLSYKDNQFSDLVYISKKYEKDLINMFMHIGMNVDFKRFRERYKYQYGYFFITLDKSVKIGNILRIKFKYNTDDEKRNKINSIKELYEKLNVEETNGDKFDSIYGKYRSSWNDLVSDIDEDEYIK